MIKSTYKNDYIKHFDLEPGTEAYLVDGLTGKERNITGVPIAINELKPYPCKECADGSYPRSLVGLEVQIRLTDAGKLNKIMEIMNASIYSWKDEDTQYYEIGIALEKVNNKRDAKEANKSLARLSKYITKLKLGLQLKGKEERKIFGTNEFKFSKFKVHKARKNGKYYTVPFVGLSSYDAKCIAELRYLKKFNICE